MSQQDGGPVPLRALPERPAPRNSAHTLRHDGFEPQEGMVLVARSALLEIMDTVKVLAPCHRNPERFHELKDEVLKGIAALAFAPARPEPTTWR
jgi:hypothetical protein